jgi:pimeloyl-ACP methyl ester carboxylesterase
MMPVERDIVANNLRHRVLEWDGGGRRTVLCLHGFLDIAWGWHWVAPLLAAAGLHVVAPDLRGHGDSERVGAGSCYHFFDYVLDLIELIEALARDRLILCGHSMGGAIASYYAASFPEQIEGLAVLEGIPLPDEPYEVLPRRTAEWARAVRRARTAGPRVYPSRDAAAARLRKVDPRCPPEVARFLAEKGTLARPDGYAFKHDPVLLARDPLPQRLDVARAYWQALRCPVLLMVAADSEYRRRVLDVPKHLASFPVKRCATIDDAGHMMLRHQPAKIAGQILEFLDEMGSGSDGDALQKGQDV